MLTVRTFGAVYVARDAGAPLTGAAAQRRLLGLLAVLAVAGEAGVSRDRILGLLWPEGELERSRHALTQTLYHARRSLACEELFLLSDGTIRLNPAVITSDVEEFERLLAAGDFARAAACYQGPFLDGFFVAGSAELEQWIATVRARLSARAAELFQHLGELAESGGAWAEAVRWRRAALTVDPLSAVATASLMNAMAAAGDRGGAIQQARIHAALLREQLELEPDPMIVDLVERLRAGSASPVSVPVVAATASANAEEAAEAGEHAAAGGGAVESPVRYAPPRTTRRLRRTLAAMLLVGGGVMIGGWAMRDGGLGAAPSVPQQLVVAPFRVSGADASLGYLRDGMVELLSTRLAGENPSRAVDAGAVLGAWRRAGLGGAADVPRLDAVRLARRLGASHVVIGSVVGNTGRLVLAATLVGTSGGGVAAEATVEGPADSLTTLVDRLAVRLLAAAVGEGPRLADRTTPSLPALRAFLEGQAVYRRGEYERALSLYEEAVGYDSTFALAALQLALAADRINAAEQHDRALAIAWANRGDLQAPDRAQLVAFAGPHYPAPSTEGEQLAAWERAVSLAPDRPDAWYALGERFFHDGEVFGLNDAHGRAVGALKRALQLNPGHVPARRLLAELAARTGDTATLAALLPPNVAHDSVDPLMPFLRWRMALARGDERELRATRAALPRLDDENLRAIAMASLFDAVAPEDGERAAALLHERAASMAAQTDALLALHSFALDAGRPSLAGALTAQVEDQLPGTRASLRLRVLDAIYGGGDTLAAARAAAALAPAADGPLAASSDERGEQLADLCTVEQWRLLHRSGARAPWSIARLRQSGIPHDAILVGANPLTCAVLLDAWWAVETGQRDALGRVQRVDSLMLGGPAVSDAESYAHLLLARLYDRLRPPRPAAGRACGDSPPSLHDGLAALPLGHQARGGSARRGDGRSTGCGDLVRAIPGAPRRAGGTDEATGGFRPPRAGSARPRGRSGTAAAPLRARATALVDPVSRWPSGPGAPAPSSTTPPSTTPPPASLPPAFQSRPRVRRPTLPPAPDRSPSRRA